MIASLEKRKKAAEYTRQHLPEIVRRSMALEGDFITIEQAKEAVRKVYERPL